MRNNLVHHKRETQSMSLAGGAQQGGELVSIVVMVAGVVEKWQEFVTVSGGGWR